MERTGQILEGKYRIVRLLGEGGMGAVYVAEHTIIGKHVAIKFLLPELAKNTEVLHRFVQEARAAAAVGHEGIIEVFDVGQAPDGSPFLVMELLDGESLRAVIDREGRLSVPFTAEVAIAVLSALAAAHEKGIVHRDVKPDNVFLERKLAAALLVKLLDFGISKMAQPEVTFATKTGIAMGTPHYMAPEQARGDTSLDRRVDIWSMGVILYEALTGALPFDGPNYNVMIVKVLTEEPKSVRELRPDLPEALEGIIVRALAKDRKLRYGRCEELIEALLPFAECVQPLQRERVASSPAVVGDLASFTGAPATPVGSEPARLEVSGGGAGGGRGGTSEPLFVSNVPSGAIPTDTTPHAWQKSVSSAPPSPPRLRGLPVRAAAIGLVVVGVAVAGVVTWLTRDAEPGPPASAAPAPPADPTPPAPAPSAWVPLAQTSPAPLPQAAGSSVSGSPLAPPAEATNAVTIRLEGVPAGARLLFDDALVTRMPIRVRRSGVMVPLKVEAEGYETFSQMVVPAEDQTITISMTAAAAPAASRGPTGPRAAGAPGAARDRVAIPRGIHAKPGPSIPRPRPGMPIQTDTGEFGQ